MPRANPEITNTSYGYSVSQYNSNTSGQVNAETWRRTYASGKTVGFPNVRPLPINGHEVLFRRVRRGAFRTGWYINQWDFYKYTGISSHQGVSMPSAENHAPYAEPFGVNSAEYAARAKVIGSIQRIKANVAQNIAEYRQVSSMFGTNVRRITNAYRALRRGDVRGLGKEIPLRKRHQQSLLNRGPLNIRSTAPSVWLEVQYGWLPLLGDTYTTLTNFYSRVEEGIVMRAVGRSGRTRSFSTKWDPDVGNITFTDFSTARYRNQYVIEYEVDNSQLANLDDWGITNPALLAWELVPYSFVVDWFYPVGDWLSQVGYSLGLHFRKGCRSGLYNVITTRNYRPKSTSYGQYVSGSDTFESLRFRREVLLTFPNPGKPRFDPDGLRGKRIANALSLLSLAFDRRR